MLASLAGTSANSTRASSIEQLPSQTFNSQPLPPSGLRTSSSPKTVSRGKMLCRADHLSHRSQNSEPPNPANVGIKPPTSAAAATLALLQDVESKMNSADSEDGGPGLSG